MKREEFCEILGGIDESYILEARAESNIKRPRWFRPLAAAACLCLVIALPVTALAVDTAKYNAAVDYLRSLGVPAEDLSGYSRREIKEAARTLDAGGSSALTEEILGAIPEHTSPDTPMKVTSEQIRALTPDMTRQDVLDLLGETQDIGSGQYIYIYEVDGAYLLRIPFAHDGAQLGVTGAALLEALSPIAELP